jgi:hypothetical protein
MRSLRLWLLFLLAGVCVAQDTNFPVGPQYLMNFGSPLFLQPIATPTFSFAALPASPAVAATEVSGGAQAVSASAKVETDLPRIYWGEPKAGGNAGEKVSEIEISSKEISTLPASIFNAGVTETLDANALRERGIGVTLAEAAAFWRKHKTRASHVYTNADIARLHGG